ncbi:zinc finger protein [Echinococcus multilocularis]|uniref:Zinc finger protein n=1 Tax=Echinococcus multilocularis TaxID=6211 RepID=A0A068YAS7_ECHMU|nr:zinc finger protein [Echinococcus multilocularis]
MCVSASLRTRVACCHRQGHASTCEMGCNADWLDRCAIVRAHRWADLMPGAANEKPSVRVCECEDWMINLPKNPPHFPMSNGENTTADEKQKLLNGALQDSECNGQEASSEVAILDENQLAQLLVRALFPSFAKEIRLQALIAYQIDGENYRSLIVNRCFKRVAGEEADNKITAISPEPVAASPLNDSGVECGDPPVSVETEGPVTQSTSRRKRKFCRPCKIPQSPPGALEEVPPCKMPEMEQHLVGQTPEVSDTIAPTLMNALASAAQLEPKHQVPILPNLNSTPPTTNKLVLPLTTTPKVSSSTPRPILPRPMLTNTTNTPVTSVQSLASLPDPSNDPVDSSETDDILASTRRYGKSFVCNQCKLAFLSLNSLCEHTYSQHKAFRCNFCGAQFTQRSNLQRHSLRHVGFKPFVCGVCQKEYYRKDHLVRHIEVTHPGTDSKKNIIVKLTSAECLDYLDAITQQHTQLQLQNPQTKSDKQEESIAPVATAMAAVVDTNPPAETASMKAA